LHKRPGPASGDTLSWMVGEGVVGLVACRTRLCEVAGCEELPMPSPHADGTV
jgi:hypothetical protein